MDLLSDPVVTEAVASSYVGPDLFFPLIAEATTRDQRGGSVIRSSAPTVVPLAKTSKAHAYTVDGATWLSVRARWRAQKDYAVGAGSPAWLRWAGPEAGQLAGRVVRNLEV